MKPTDQELENRFNYHAPGTAARERHKIVTERTLDLAKTLRNVVPDSRGLSLALTALEECRMWANQGIATSVSDMDVLTVAAAAIEADRGVIKALEDM